MPEVLTEWFCCLSSRFPDTDLLFAFGILSVRPLSFLSPSDLQDWGNEQLDYLISKHGEPQIHRWKEGSETFIETRDPIINAEKQEQSGRT